MSPSAAGGGNEEWFERFFAECEILGCRIDYLATHDYHGETEVVMNRLEELYHRWLLFVSFQSFWVQNVSRYGKKIWLTEFAKCCTHDEDEIMDFVKEIIPRLEEADYIYRYSIVRKLLQVYHKIQWEGHRWRLVSGSQEWPLAGWRQWTVWSWKAL